MSFLSEDMDQNQDCKGSLKDCIKQDFNGKHILAIPSSPTNNISEKIIDHTNQYPYYKLLSMQFVLFDDFFKVEINNHKCLSVISSFK